MSSEINRLRRERELVGLGVIWDRAELDDLSPEGRRLIIRRLQSQIVLEASLIDHWSYDLAWHRGLFTALAQERAELAELEQPRDTQATPDATANPDPPGRQARDSACADRRGKAVD